MSGVLLVPDDPTWDSLKFCRMLKSRGWTHEPKLNSEVLVPKDWNRWMRCMYIM